MKDSYLKPVLLSLILIALLILLFLSSKEYTIPKRNFQVGKYEVIEKVYPVDNFLMDKEYTTVYILKYSLFKEITLYEETGEYPFKVLEVYEKGKNIIIRAEKSAFIIDESTDSIKHFDIFHIHDFYLDLDKIK
jgi:hypothetical protein